MTGFLSAPDALLLGFTEPYEKLGHHGIGEPKPIAS